MRLEDTVNCSMSLMYFFELNQLLNNFKARNKNDEQTSNAILESTVIKRTPH